jgi:hypothetical protein
MKNTQKTDERQQQFTQACLKWLAHPELDQTDGEEALALVNEIQGHFQSASLEQNDTLLATCLQAIEQPQDRATLCDFINILAENTCLRSETGDEFESVLFAWPILIHNSVPGADIEIPPEIVTALEDSFFNHQLLSAEDEVLIEPQLRSIDQMLHEPSARYRHLFHWLEQGYAPTPSGTIGASSPFSLYFISGIIIGEDPHDAFYQWAEEMETVALNVWLDHVTNSLMSLPDIIELHPSALPEHYSNGITQGVALLTSERAARFLHEDNIYAGCPPSSCHIEATTQSTADQFTLSMSCFSRNEKRSGALKETQIVLPRLDVQTQSFLLAQLSDTLLHSCQSAGFGACTLNNQTITIPKSPINDLLFDDNMQLH